MNTVYIEINPNYSRTVWDSSGATNYVAGDRVSYDDGVNDLIFVCLADNNSTTTPNNDSTNWVAAGSKDYPFQTKGSLAFSGSMPAGWPGPNHLNGELSLNEYQNVRQDRVTYPNEPINFAYQAAGPGGTIIFADGDYATPKGAAGNSFGAANITLKSLNFQKATLLTPYGFTVSGSKGPAQSSGPLVIDSFIQYRTYSASGSTGSDAINTVTFRDCYITDEHPASAYQNTATSDTSNGGTVGYILSEFTFFYNCSIVHKRYNVRFLSYADAGNAENCTFYIQVANTTTGHSLFHAHDTTNPLNLKNCIVYVKHFYKSLQVNAFFGNTPVSTLDQVTWFIENNYSGVDPQAGSTVSYSDDLVRFVDPLFIDGDKSNFSLRPSSPLIGGLKKSSPAKNTSHYDKVLYITPATSNKIKGEWAAKTNTSLSPDWSAGDRCNYNGEVYEALVGHNTDGTSTSPDQDTTNWRLVPAGDINDPYRATDLGPSVLNSLTDSSVIFMLDGDYPAIPICYNLLAWNGDNLVLNHPQNGKPLLTPLNKGKVTISQSNFKPANILCKDIEILNPYISTHTGYPENIGVHFLGCTLHTSYWLPPSNSIAENCLIHHNSTRGMFYASLGSTNNPNPDSKAIQFINNTILLNISDGESPISSLINQGLGGALIKNNIFYVKPGSVVNTDSGVSHVEPKSTIIDNVLFDTTGTVVTGYTDGLINVDPKFIEASGSTIEDFQLRPSSPLIGGIKKDLTNVYYLQPGNPYNGDGSQKDASSMTADGDPGPFNEFKEIVAAGVPYGSTVIILNGTYDWTESFGRNPSTNVYSGTWYSYTCAGYNYVAETSGEVIFDAKLDPANVFIYKPYGGTFPTSGTGAVGVFLDLHTTFNGIQFNNMMGSDSFTGNQISSVSDSAGLGSCTFKNCKFLGHINRSSHPWTGGGRSKYSSSMHWENCEISIAFDQAEAGGLFAGGDGFANDTFHGAWSWENCTFYIPVGLTTFSGRNAANGTYVSPNKLFGNTDSQSSRLFTNNIVYIPGGSCLLGISSAYAHYLPQIENNCFLGVDVSAHLDLFLEKNNLIDIDPEFVDPSNNNFSLRPTSSLIGKGQ